MACPTSRKCTRRDFGLDLPRPDCLRDYTTAPSEISRFPLMKLMHMPQVSDSGEPNEHSPNALLHVAFPIVQQGRHSRTVISELNTAPMHTLTNASPRHHWSSRHSSGPEWIATPYSAEDLALKPHLLLHAGFNRRFLDVPKSIKSCRLFGILFQEGEEDLKEFKIFFLRQPGYAFLVIAGGLFVKIWRIEDDKVRLFF